METWIDVKRKSISDARTKRANEKYNECEECGTELIEREINREKNLCEQCDDECYCSRCVG